jgi:hypothetical protein
MARAYRATSGEALCILTGMKPIIIKLEEIVKQCEFKERQHQQESYLDHEVEHCHWPHPATAIPIKEIETLYLTSSISYRYLPCMDLINA